MVVSVLSCLGGCCLWRKRHCCCRGSSHRDEPSSERDSTGSCYFPPQYSRCSSFHHAPPPYTEVTSKPDLYPLVISYADGGGGKGGSGGGGGGGGNYLMVQYFRNYLVRPMARSLSHTSTVDSLSSSFLYNEANTTIPPPYSCAGSLEDFQLPPPPASAAPPPRSVSDLSIVRQQPPPRTHRSPLHYVSTSSEVSSLAGVGPPDSPPQATSPTSEIRDLLDKIQQLPLAEADGDDSVDTSSSRVRRYRHRNAYAPLTLSLSRSKWLPRSAPNTPSSNYPPPLLLARPSSSSSRQGEGSPLLEAADTDEML